MRRSGRPSGGVEGGERYSARDLAILAAWQLALIGGLSSLVGWWAYPVLWLLPVYAFTFAADISRVFLEHSRLEDDATADQSKRLVTFHAPWWERVLLAPMNMNFHAAHHLWPAIPYYHLHDADAALKSASGAQGGLVWRNSYFGYLVEYLRAVRDRPGSSASA
jgi:fatty acid desaturase